MYTKRWLWSLFIALTTLGAAAQSRQPGAQGTDKKGWQYQQTSDQIMGTTNKASLDATDLLQLPYPYAGGSVVTLTIRNRAGSITAYLSVTKGLIASSYQGGKAQVRVNGGKPGTFSLSAAANGRGNLVFFDDAERLIRQLRTANTMAIQLQMPGQRLNEINFNSAGFRWK